MIFLKAFRIIFDDWDQYQLNSILAHGQGEIRLILAEAR
jgi:hypothetical protein